MAAHPEEKDVTLMELVENPELVALGDTAATESRSKMAQLADEELIKAQVQADEGNLDNFMLLLKLSWHKHGDDTTIPKFYRNEANRTTISKAVAKRRNTTSRTYCLPDFRCDTFRGVAGLWSNAA
jgi:hypothetical protein